jgi:hypothetical protein
MKYFIFSILKFVLLLVINKENDIWSINHNSIGNINIVKLNIFIQIFWSMFQECLSLCLTKKTIKMNTNFHFLKWLFVGRDQIICSNLIVSNRFNFSGTNFFFINKNRDKHLNKQQKKKKKKHLFSFSFNLSCHLFFHLLNLS